MKALRFVAAAVLSGLFASVLFGQSTAFSYQGSLDSNGGAANGNHDFEFLLFDLISGGSQIGTTVSISNVNVTNGLFSVTLDFGDQFPGSDRFLEIRVRPAGQGSPTTLAPRQRIATVPYAVRSSSASNAANALQLAGVAANQYVLTTDPRMTDARNPVPNSPDYVQNRTTTQTSSNFNVSGNGTAGGTLSGNIVNAQTQFNLSAGRVLASSASNANLFAGLSAGANNSTGSENSFVGVFAGENNTIGRFNSFYGSNAGRSNDDGEQNSFFGYLSGAANDSNSNSFFGAFSGEDNVSGNSNSFFGNSAGQMNLSGSRNTFNGKSAGRNNTTGADNSFFGQRAGFSNESGINNTFAGSIAGQENISGSNNSFFGLSAGGNNVAGIENSFFGAFAGNLNLGSFNTFLGYRAGDANTSGAVNVFVGLDAGGSNTTGGANVFVGNNAGDSNTAGASSTFIGRDAGDTNATGNNNSAFGRGSDVGSSGLSFATAIGSETVVTASNTIQLGRSGTDRVRIGALGSSGSTSLCLNASSELSTCSSSVRYKSNVLTFTPGLDLIMRLRPVSFNWRDGETLDLGLVAEEVAEVEPLLTTTKNGQVEGVKYDRVGVVLVNAVNEQQEQIEKLEAKVKALEALVCELKPDAALCKAN